MENRTKYGPEEYAEDLVNMDEWDEGSHAAHTGFRREENPYPKQPKKWDAWNAGYDAEMATFAESIRHNEPITADNLFDACRRGEIPPCPKCGRAGFIEDEHMVIIGVCPECSGKGQNTPEIDGGSWEEQCMAARELKDIFKAEAASLRCERDELMEIARTINEYASGWKPWGGCRCDHGEDGRAQLRGEKCGRCKALDRLREISQHSAKEHPTT
jgi:hypothetical protein